MGSANTSHLSVLLSLKGLKVGPNMKRGDTDGRSIDILRWPWGTTKPPPMVPAKGLQSGMSEGQRQQNKEVDLIVNPGGGKT